MSSTAFPISGKTPNSKKRRYIDIEDTSDLFFNLKASRVTLL